MNTEEQPLQAQSIEPRKHSWAYKLLAIIASIFLIFLSIQGYLYWVAIS